jgi:hypothetical protein
VNPRDLPPPDSEIWNTAVTLLEDELRACPDRALDQVRFCGIGVGNTAVQASAGEVHLRITHTSRPTVDGVPAKPVAVWDLGMPPAFARYLASLLDAHARYVITAPGYPHST